MVKNSRSKSLELGKGAQKIQTCSYKINKSWDIMYSMMTKCYCVLFYI